MVRPIEGRLKTALEDIVTRRLPNEAAGIILPNDVVIELENTAESPTDRFEFSKAELASALHGVEDVSDLVIWHSHPGGGIGPSRIDIRQKTPLKYHLVVSILANEFVYTWY